MTVLFFGFVVLVIAGICSSTSAKNRDKKRAAEINKQRKEQIRMREEWKQRLAEAKIETDRLVALEREAMRLSAVQEKQAVQLAKHEEQIAKLNFRMAEAERTLNHYKPLLENLLAKQTELDNKVWYYKQRGLPCSGAEKELAKISEQVFKMEGKINKAEFEKRMAENKLSA